MKFTNGASLIAFEHLENYTKFAPRHFWMIANNCAFGFVHLEKTHWRLESDHFFCVHLGNPNAQNELWERSNTTSSATAM